jgi:hypothetical protein
VKKTCSEVGVVLPCKPAAGRSSAPRSCLVLAKVLVFGRQPRQSNSMPPRRLSPLRRHWHVPQAAASSSLAGGGASTSWRHSLKNRTSDRAGEVVGSLVHRSDQWFIGSMSEPVIRNIVYFNTEMLKLNSEVGWLPTSIRRWTGG